MALGTLALNPRLSQAICVCVLFDWLTDPFMYVNADEVSFAFSGHFATMTPGVGLANAVHASAAKAAADAKVAACISSSD